MLSSTPFEPTYVFLVVFVVRSATSINWLRLCSRFESLAEAMSSVKAPQNRSVFLHYFVKLGYTILKVVNILSEPFTWHIDLDYYKWNP